MGTARRPPSFNRRPETVDHNRERERERDYENAEEDIDPVHPPLNIGAELFT